MRRPLEAVPWDELDGYPDRMVTQTREWLAFVAETQRAEPVVASIHTDGDAPVGYFTGLVVRRAGLRILGSPLPGWTTDYMGFNLRDPSLRSQALGAAIEFAYRDLRCQHVELRDRFLLTPTTTPPRTRMEPVETYDVDLRPEADDIFGAFTSACRRAVRRSEKVGLTVEVAEPDGFAAEYHEQLIDVFAKQGLTPTYDVTRVEALIRHLHPTGRLLLLRARDPEGTPIATGIFPGHGSTAFFWGGASFRSGQQHRPNEAIFWHAIQTWKSRGATTLDLGGGGDYKLKYGANLVALTHLAVPRYELLWRLRERVRRRNDPDNPEGRFATP